MRWGVVGEEKILNVSFAPIKLDVFSLQLYISISKLILKCHSDERVRAEDGNLEVISSICTISLGNF